MQLALHAALNQKAVGESWAYQWENKQVNYHFLGRTLSERVAVTKIVYLNVSDVVSILLVDLVFICI